MSLDHRVKAFRIISFLEAISFLVLLLIAMPLKYIWHEPFMVETVGMAHGVLFIAYILGALILFRPLGWDLRTFGIVCLSSVLPLGPFYVEKKYL